MDFDDLLAQWLAAAAEQAEVRSITSGGSSSSSWMNTRTRTSSRATLIDLLAARHHNVMVVGDDAQSIIRLARGEFREHPQVPGALPGNAKTYRIETNYRSTPEILQVANAALRPKCASTRNTGAGAKPGAKPVKVLSGRPSTAVFVAQRVLNCGAIWTR